MRQTNWIKRAHKIATDNGFHDEKYSDKHFVSLIVAELYEAVEAHRENRRADGIQFQENKAKEGFQKSFEKYIKDTMEDEMADAYIRILDLAGERKEDIALYHIEIQENQSFNEQIHDIAKDLLNTGNLNTAASTIVCLSYLTGIHLEYHIELKMKYNETREYKHGKRY